MIAARFDKYIEDFPCCATDWNKVVGYASQQYSNLLTVPVGEAVKAKLTGKW